MQFNIPQFTLGNTVDVNDLPHSNDARRDIKLVTRECTCCYTKAEHCPDREQMTTTFPVIYRLVGETFFNQLINEYLHRYPPTADEHQNVSDCFPQFLLQLSIERKELDKLRFLPELARLEWLLQYAYFADDDQKFDLKELAHVPPAQLNDIIFTLSHTLNLMFTDWPVFDIWCAYQEEQPEELEIKQCDGAQWLCIHREDGHSVIDVVPDNVALILGEMMRGHPLGELAKNCTHIDSYLPQMVRQGWLNGFYIDKAA